MMRQESTHCTRRAFLHRTQALGLSAALYTPHWLFGQNPAANSLVRGKDRRLTVLSRDPIVLETPLSLLQQRITPKELLFVRNNQLLANAATLQSLPLREWRLELTGLIGRTRSITGAELARLPSVEHEMVLQCSGNGRSLYAAAQRTSGTQWGQGGVGNVRFRGVALSALLQHLQIRVPPAVRFLTAEGRDGPSAEQADFEHSLPIDDVRRTSILATHLNGEALPAIHGGPLRLVTPGYYATMHMKWLSRLRFERTESTNHNHVPRYRVPDRIIRPGAQFEFTLANSTPTWKMKVASIVLTPRPVTPLRAGRIQCRGIAFNDGAARIESVLLSADRGQTWRRAEIDRPRSNYAWATWNWETRLQAGNHEIWSRATDALGRSQPLDGTIFWNPRGYQWHGVDKVRVRVA